MSKHIATSLHIDEYQEKILCSCGRTFFHVRANREESASTQIQRHIDETERGAEISKQ